MVAINTELIEDIHRISVVGEIDASSSIELDNAIKEAAKNHRKILMDLQQLDYISSAGLGVFISYLEDLKNQQIRLVVFGLQETVSEVFSILGLQHLMNIKTSEKEAIEFLNEG